MYQLDMEKFGSFLSMLRKEKNLTQKELGERLFVSDKTVSKWERGQSIPNVSLLIPISEILDVTVTELLKGERIQNNSLSLQEIEELVAGSVQLSAQEQEAIDQNKKKWHFAFYICFAIVILEFIITYFLCGPSIFENTPLLIGTGLSLLFASWFCLFSKDILPTFYDENKLNFVSDGIFRMNMPGLHFNNSNWPHILNASRIYLLGMSIGIPVLYLLLWVLMDLKTAGMMATYITNFIILPFLLGLLAVIYIVGKKHE